MDIRKLRDYCLNPDSPKGRTKARVFSASLRLAPGDAEFLHQILLQAAANEECRPSEADDHGQRYTVDLMVATSRGSQRVRSGWIVRADEDFPRLTTCYVLKSGKLKR